jgi:mycothiol synthase
MVRNIDKDLVLKDALEAEGFQAVRFVNRMARDLSEPIVIPPLPAGLEARPVPETHYWAAAQAIDEACQDHWGHAPLTQEGFQQWIADPQFKPGLWQVAWDGGEIAAGVFNRVDEDANKQFNVQRGWTEPIFTRRPWRRRGLARALLMRSLRMLKDMGMTEAALVVDTQNPLGALGLYESCGFRMEYRSVIYEKGVLV